MYPPYYKTQEENTLTIKPALQTCQVKELN
jgi:hypothetical protein